jgi:hypothetical protein
LEGFYTNTPYIRSPAEVSRSSCRRPGLTQSILQWYPTQAQNISIHQRSQSAVSDYVGNTTEQPAYFPSLPYYETSARPASVPQIHEGNCPGYTTSPSYSIPFTNNVHYQPTSPDIRHTTTPSTPNSSYDHLHGPLPLTSLPRDPAGRFPYFSQHHSSDFSQNTGPILANGQDPSFLQILETPFSRRRSARNRVPNQPEKLRAQNTITSRRRSRSRSAGSRQLSCTPTLVGEHYSQTGSTLEANQCSTCKKVLRDERGLK